MNFADYGHMVAGLDADIAASPFAPHLVNPVAVAFNAGNFESVAFQADAANQIDLWPEPTSLPNALPPVQAFDADLLPMALRGWVMDIAHRMQCPPDFPAVAALVALSSLIGARAVVQPKARDDWQVVPNLWG